MTTRPTVIRVDFDAIEHNLKLYRELTSLEVFGVVKANAYGHGDVEVSRFLVSSGVQVLCVSSLDEAQHLVRNGIQCDILIFGPVPYESIEKYHCNQFIYTVTSYEWFKNLPTLSHTLRLHIEINTGMNRLGFRDTDEVRSVIDSSVHVIEGIYTHFSSADESFEVTKAQYDRFKSIVTSLDYEFKWIHAGNSHGAFQIEDSLINAERIGIGLYGFIESSVFSEISGSVKQALSLYSQIIHIDTLEVGETVGYNRTYIAKEREKFATLPIGYADGLNPLNRNLDVFVNDLPCKVLGKICMDQMMIRVDDTVHVGDYAEIIGKNRPLVSVAHATQVIPYVVLSQLSDRITREYYYHKELVKSVNTRHDPH